MTKLLIILSCIVGLAGLSLQAFAESGTDSSAGRIVPSPDCIQTILNQDVAVNAADCLADVTTFTTATHSSWRGTAYPVAEAKTADYTMRIHYTDGSFPDAATANWPLSIDLNFGGSGWFSYLLILVETQDGAIASGFVQSAGDRCNDGFARWDRLSENGNGIYRRSATPFRLVNPLDETNWRDQSTALLFEGADGETKRQALLQMADPPLYEEWLPYEMLENCALCCVGEIVIMQSMLGNEIDPGRDYGLLGVVLYPDAIAALATSDKMGDRCLAAGLDTARQRAEPAGRDGDGLFLYRQSWLEIRDRLAESCPD